MVRNTKYGQVTRLRLPLTPTACCVWCDQFSPTWAANTCHAAWPLCRQRLKARAMHMAYRSWISIRTRY